MVTELDYSHLRGRMVEKFGTVTGFANAINVAPQTICSKLNGDRNVTKNDVLRWSKVLDIDMEKIGEYFFVEKVDSSKLPEVV